MKYKYTVDFDDGSKEIIYVNSTRPSVVWEEAEKHETADRSVLWVHAMQF